MQQRPGDGCQNQSCNAQVCKVQQLYLGVLSSRDDSKVPRIKVEEDERGHL